jgi:ATP-binding cassette, subfamily C, bacterial
MKKQNINFLHSVLRLFKEYPLRSFVIILLALISGFAEGIGVASILPLLNIMIEPTAAETSIITEAMFVFLAYLNLPADIEVILLLIVILLIIKVALTSFSLGLSGYSVALIAKDFRSKLSMGMLSESTKSYSDISGGSSAAIMSSEITRASSMYINATKIIMGAIRALLLFSVAFILSPQIAFSVLAISLLLYLILNNLQVSQREAGRELTESMRKLSSEFVDFLKLIKPIKVMGEAKAGRRLLQKETDRIYMASRQQMFNVVLLQAIHELLPIIIVSIIFVISYSYYSIEFSEILVSLLVFHRFYGSMSELQRLWLSILGTKDAFIQVLSNFEISNEDKNIHIKSEGESLNISNICFRNVTFKYEENLIIKGANVCFQNKDLSVLTGESGAGKTTIIDLITRFIDPLSGTISVGGKDIDSININQWRSSIGYVPQEPVLLNSSLLDNVRLWNNSISEERVNQVLKNVGLSKFVINNKNNLNFNVGEHGSKLSGGERQRISIARAIIRNPKVLILDEVTSNLDSNSEIKICNLIKEISKNIMVIAISHRPLMIEMSKNIFLVQDGIIIEKE